MLQKIYTAYWLELLLRKICRPIVSRVVCCTTLNPVSHKTMHEVHNGTPTTQRRVVEPTVVVSVNVVYKYETKSALLHSARRSRPIR